MRKLGIIALFKFSFRLKLQNSPKLPHKHAIFYCDANEQSQPRKELLLLQQKTLLILVRSVSKRKCNCCIQFYTDGGGFVLSVTMIRLNASLL